MTAVKPDLIIIYDFRVVLIDLMMMIMDDISGMICV